LDKRLNMAHHFHRKLVIGGVISFACHSCPSGSDEGVWDES
jgi:hypothetical protein